MSEASSGPGGSKVAPASAARLIVESGPESGQECDVLRSPFVIGRDRSADLFIDDRSASRSHVALILRNARWILQDLGGTNAPKIHGRPVVSVPLLDGDQIQVGKTRLRFEAEGSASDSSPDVSDGESLEIPADSQQISPHRAQQLAGRPLWEVLARWTDLLRNLDKQNELLERALDGWLQVIPAERVGIYRLDPEVGTLTPLASRNFGKENPVDFSETIVAKAIKDRVSKLYSPEIDGGADVARSRSMIRKRIRTALCLPLLAEGGVWGIVYLDQVSDDRPPLLPADLELGNLLAQWVAEALEKAERFQELDEELVRLRADETKDPILVGESRGIRDVRRRIRKVASSDVTVLVAGESGTGKELVAAGVHRLSGRREAPIVAINCAAIPENLLESELFGYAAHSGIHGADPAGKPGRFEQASGGTLFLDEVGELAAPLQAKLLRVLEERVVDRIGGRESIPVDVRVVAATNRDLYKEVEAGRFREDLYYRLRVFPIELPPLRERPEDVLPITQHLLAQIATGKVRISPRAQELLCNFPWPGNVRQLKNALLEALLAGDGKTINPRDLPSLADPTTLTYQSLREIERQHIVRVLEAVQWNKKKAAEMLGIHRSTLYEKISEHKLEPVVAPSKS
ncbi:MAG: sigma 54-interacting transcriptional regulator [Planctomycetota bacterium]